MTKKQKKLIEKYEFALANIVFDGRKDLAAIWGPIVEAFQREEFVWAVLLAENANVPDSLLDDMRNNFGVKRFS